ncbi:hypothetical protein GUJ93_ZPchr0004g39927 [Zizania palustris]|uniref:mitogen-activated protein kinase kinase kinase n=1 Tax=Zizania palustris TaxID=103762 RepID=A0A8J5S5E5_ZIZPA|nr:hypothetical protein GUJ93_ZPchr0004g39927 [Zizania palustris]
MPAWWPRKSKSKSKSGAVAVSAASSPRKSADLDFSASTSPSPTPRARDKARSLDSPAARHGGGRGGGVLGAVGYKLPLPEPVAVTGPEPEPESEPDSELPPLRSPYDEAVDVAAVAGDASSQGSGMSSPESLDEGTDQHVSRSIDPVAFIRGRNMPSDSYRILNEDNHLMSYSMPREHPKFFEIPDTNIGELHLHSDDPSTSEARSGTFGQVYLGFNSQNGQFCAIKEVQVILDDPHSKERLKQLNQEIEMLRQLSHPNIVQYYGSEMTDDALSIYLEYVSGGSIHKLLREYGPFKEPVIRNYTGQILSGLAYLHGRNTVHRDIKGANILVGPNGEVKLADFGMAKHISSFAEIRSLKGSPYWMAPEVIMNSKGYNLPVDIWSLGCTIIEMATAKPPWHKYEGVAAIFKIANSKDIPEIPDSFSEEGKSFLQLCLKRDPASRSSATQLMDHPFVQDHPAVRAAKSSALRNMFSAPADGRNTMSNRDFLSRRSITPLKDIGVRSRDFTGFSPAVPLPHTASSPISVRTNMSLPVSPCSSPMRQFKQTTWSCLPSPPHPTYSSGSTAYNISSYMTNEMRRSPTVSDTWQDGGQPKLQSPYGSPRRF